MEILQLGLQDWSLYELKQLIFGIDVEVGQLTAPDLAFCGSWVDRSPEPLPPGLALWQGVMPALLPVAAGKG